MNQNGSYKILVINKEDRIEITGKQTENLRDALVRNGILIRSDCGGRGTCGKCKVQFIEGVSEITAEDKKVLSEDEIKEGIRLSCKALPIGKGCVKIHLQAESDFQAITDFMDTKLSEEPPINNQLNTRNSKICNTSSLPHSYGIAIDIGTTTLAIALLDLNSGKVMNTYTAVNSQRVYGADIISRISASNEGRKDELRHRIQEDLLTGIQQVIVSENISKNFIKRIVIAANTTMVHLLMGYSCEGLGKYPFHPVNINTITADFSEVFESDYLDVPVVILPGIAAFVGGDIVAGLLACHAEESSAPFLLVDLGTNGEMAIGSRKKIIVSSTAAGPAFEGVNISNGVGSIPGAICHAVWLDQKLLVDTIENKPAVGICGTGVVEIIAELLKADIINNTGLLTKDFFDQGYPVAKQKNFAKISITQRDIRELQLAKAAIRTGIESMFSRFGCSFEEIGEIYLAGGFGYKMDIKKAIRIGLLPEEFQHKVKAVGNSSLAGAIMYLTREDSLERVDKILKVSEEINLANEVDFNDRYISFLNF